MPSPFSIKVLLYKQAFKHLHIMSPPLKGALICKNLDQTDLNSRFIYTMCQSYLQKSNPISDENTILMSTLINICVKIE